MWEKQNNWGNVRWILCSQGKLKLNFDCITRGNPGLSEVGCNTRDDNGKMIWVASKKLVSGINNEVEAQALLLGLQLWSNKDIQDIIIEGDSKVIINVRKIRTSPSGK
ncbi:hypothetical protein SUGI_0632060 [Cryptomeria japonica]|nr:hypothetical protein SUGI_0632060 [Cryptomeria japonica]